MLCYAVLCSARPGCSIGPSHVHGWESARTWQTGARNARQSFDRHPKGKGKSEVSAPRPSAMTRSTDGLEIHHPLRFYGAPTPNYTMSAPPLPEAYCSTRRWPQIAQLLPRTLGLVQAPMLRWQRSRTPKHLQPGCRSTSSSSPQTPFCTTMHHASHF